MHLVSIVGARPQFIKIAPVSRAIERYNVDAARLIEDVIVHTGQHYDHGMSRVFFEELEIPEPSVDLQVGSGPHGQQTGRMLERIEALLLQRKADMVVTYGDTNSTVAGALAGAKLGIPVAHVEAGLRSFKRDMPEEINRIASDHISDLLLAPTATAMRNLAAENLSERSINTGDVMYDALLYNRELADKRSQVLERLKLTDTHYGVVTVHRAENTEANRLAELLETLNEVARRHLVLVFPVHPRTANLIKAELEGWRADPALRLIEPLGYLDMLKLVEHAAVVLTDSGGLQKEAFFLNCPCVTLRGETEWVETVEGGGNVVVGCDRDRVVRAVGDWLQSNARGRADFSHHAKAFFGDGKAAGRIVRHLHEFHLKGGEVING